MSDIATKLQYLNTTKGKIKDVINMTGVGITNDTFRSYAQSLYSGYIATLQDKGTLLDNMNKGTSTGTISDSANLPVYEYKASKLSTQNTSTQSANLLDEEYLKTATYEIATYKNTLTNIKGNRQLYVKAQLKEGKTAISGLYVRLSSTQNPTVSGAVYGIFVSNGVPFTNAQPDFSNNDTLYFTFYPTTVNVSDIFDTYNFWVSTTDTSYTPFVPNSPSPDYPSEVKTVKGYRNLFDVATWVQKGNNSNYYSYTNNTLSINTLDTRSLQDFTETEKIYLPNGTYYLSNIGNAGIRIYNTNENSPVLTNEFTVTLGYIYIKLVSSSVITCNPMISKGTTELPYVPYGTNWIYTTISDGTNSKIIPIPLNNNEVCGMGDYKDELVIDKYGHAKLTKKIGKVVLDGTQGLLLRNTSANGTYTYSLNTSFEYKIEENASIFSNYFNSLGTVIGVSKMYDDYLDILGIALYYNSSSLSTRVVYINSNVDLTTWLPTHNTDIYYVLETPIEIDLGTVEMELYEGTNNITNSEDMDMSIQFIKNVYE